MTEMWAALAGALVGSLVGPFVATWLSDMRDKRLSLLSVAAEVRAHAIELPGAIDEFKKLAYAGRHIRSTRSVGLERGRFDAAGQSVAHWPPALATRAVRYYASVSSCSRILEWHKMSVIDAVGTLEPPLAKAYAESCVESLQNVHEQQGDLMNALDQALRMLPEWFG